MPHHYLLFLDKAGDMWHPNLILHDGGDATDVLVKKFPAVTKHIRGLVEESITGVHRLYRLVKISELSCPAMNIHDAVTKTMLNNYYCQKESLVDGLKVTIRCLDILGVRHFITRSLTFVNCVCHANLFLALN